MKRIMHILLMLGAALGLFLICGVVYFLSGFGDNYVLFYSILGISIFVFMNFAFPTTRRLIAKMMSLLMNSKVALVIFLFVVLVIILYALPYLNNLTV